MKKHTRATPSGVPRSRSKFTRAQRRRMGHGFIARRLFAFEFPVGMTYSFVVLNATTSPPV